MDQGISATEGGNSGRKRVEEQSKVVEAGDWASDGLENDWNLWPGKGRKTEAGGQMVGCETENGKEYRY